jgi:multicomponent Na+:H+ antiporter subunit D
VFATRTDPREPPTEDSELTGSRGRIPGVMFASAGVLIVAGLLVAAVPGTMADAQRSAQAFADRAAYAAAVFQHPTPPREQIEYLHPGAIEVILGLVAALAAIGLAAVLLERLRPPFRLPPVVQRAAATNLERLRRQHSGQIGDYVAWATIGFAALGALFAVVT